MENIMKAAITDGKGNVWIDEVPLPKPNDYQCLCKIAACATCSGTDQKMINNKLPWEQNYPGILGHESFGRVVEVGSKVRNIARDDRFLRPSAVYPEEKLGKYFSLWGGFAEYGLVTDVQALREDQPEVKLNNYTKYQQRFPVGFTISAADATMLITLKEAASYVSSTGVGLYKSLLILGSGCVALSMLRFAKIFGAYPVIVAGRRAEPLLQAEKIGADFIVNVKNDVLEVTVKKSTRNRGVDFIIDTTGDAGILKEALALLAPGGKVAPYATYEKGKNINEVIGENKLAPSSVNEDLVHQYLIDGVKLSLVNPGDFYTHKMPFAQIKEGFEMLRNKEALKIVFEM